MTEKYDEVRVSNKQLQLQKKFIGLLPTTIYLFGKEYDIIYHNSLYMDEAEVHGYVDCDKKTINIKLDDPMTMCDTLKHECRHAIFFESGLTFLFRDVSDAMEETVIRALDNGLNDLLDFAEEYWPLEKLAALWNQALECTET